MPPMRAAVRDGGLSGIGTSGRNSVETSAAPDWLDAARLPCLATGIPAPATTSAAQVEML